MCWVSIAPAARASRWKRPTSFAFPARSPVLMTLMATRRPVEACSASYTEPIEAGPEEPIDAIFAVECRAWQAIGRTSRHRVSGGNGRAGSRPPARRFSGRHVPCGAARDVSPWEAGPERPGPGGQSRPRGHASPGGSGYFDFTNEARSGSGAAVMMNRIVGSPGERAVTGRAGGRLQRDDERATPGSTRAAIFLCRACDRSEDRSPTSAVAASSLRA